MEIFKVRVTRLVYKTRLQITKALFDLGDIEQLN